MEDMKWFSKKVWNHFCDSIGDDCKYRNFL